MFHPGVVANASLDFPSGFTWPQSTYPLDFGYDGTKYTSDFDPTAYAAAALAGTQYFVNVGTGSDVADGFTSGTAVKSIWKAIQLGNATATPYRVSIAPGSYPRENGFTNTGTLVPATQPAAFVASGAGVECWTGSTLTWPGSPDATFTSTYKVTRGSVARVLNIGATDANGDYAELTRVADATTCNSTPNSWAQSGSDLYVHRPAEAAPTNLNTRVLLKSTPNLQTGATSKDMYVSGIDFQGGNVGCVYLGAAATLNFMAVDCSAKFSGSSTDLVDAWRLDNITGIVGLVRCTAACAAKDGINFHWSPGGTPTLYGITVDCIGRNNGRDTSTSNNGLTLHDDIIAVDVNGEYYGNYGTNVIPINACLMFCLGTYAHDSEGDTGLGGTSGPIDYQTQMTARLWLQETRSATSTNSLSAANTSVIRKRRHTATGGQTEVVGAGATIAQF